jgi:hypothetical protein
MNPPNITDNRRLFFRYLARETVAWFEEFGGKPNVNLADLPKLPPEALAALIPRMLPGIEIIPGKDQVSARLPGAAEPVVLFPANDANLAVFNRFNGVNTIGSVAAELSAALSWPPEQSLGNVKRLFFRLVSLRVCVPANTVPAP